jgi:AICAR transformylase/IMP cyclohydrolase PurH
MKGTGAQAGSIGYDTKFRLAKKVFAHTAQYDGAITNYLTSLGEDKQHATRAAYPQTLNLHFEKVQDMRYGENPHQSAAFYRDLAPAPARWPTTASCRARNCRTTTSPTPMRPGNASSRWAASSSRPAA